MFLNKWKISLILFLTFVLILNLQPILTIADDEDREHEYNSEWYEDEDDDEEYDDEYDHDEDEDGEYDDEAEGDYNNNQDKVSSSDKNQNSVELPSIDLNAFTWDRYQLPKSITQNDVFYQQSYTLLKQGNTESTQVKVLFNNDIVYLPLKQTAQFLNAEILWHPNYEVIEVKTADKQLLFKINSAVSYEKGKKLPMPAKTFLFNDTVYVPAGVLIDGLDYIVESDKANQNSLILERR